QRHCRFRPAAAAGIAGDGGGRCRHGPLPRGPGDNGAAAETPRADQRRAGGGGTGTSGGAMKRRVWLSIGANLGDRAGTIARAVGEIDGIPGTAVTAASALYATEPVGFTDQPEFLNCAV